MFHRSRKLLLLQVMIDALVINVAVALAWYIRYELELTPPVGEGFAYQPYSAYLPFAAALTLIAVLIFRIEGLYPISRGQSFLDEIYNIGNGATTAILILMAFTFFFRPVAYSRSMYVYTALLVFFFLVLERAIARQVWARLRKRGTGVDHILIVGAGEVGRAIMRNIVARADLAYHIEGFVDDHPERGQTDIGRFKALGNLDNLARLLHELPIDEIIVALPWTARHKIIDIMKLCQRAGVTAKIVPDMFQLSMSRVAIDDVGGIPLISVRESQMSLLDTIIKRVIDLVGTLLLLIVFVPIMLVFVILIRLDSPGPIIFTQTRIGRWGIPFITYKFRTMRPGAEEEQATLSEQNEATGPIFKIRNDPRRTRVGRWLRKSSLDELPQLLNVLKGQMSLVGPRPAMTHEVEQYHEWHKRRLDVLPGLTGLWQVSTRSEMIFDEMVMLDIYYIENWSPWLDIWILLRTIPTVLFGRGGY